MQTMLALCALFAVAHASSGYVPAHVAAHMSKQDFTLRCPAGQAEAECKKSFPKVWADDHNGAGIAVTKRVAKLCASAASASLNVGLAALSLWFVAHAPLRHAALGSLPTGTICTDK